MVFLAIPLVVPAAKAVVVGIGAAAVAVAGFLGFRKSKPQQVPVRPQQPPAASPSASLMSKVCEEVKQAVAEGVTAVRETVGKTAAGVKKFIADAPECFRNGSRLISKAATKHGMRLALQRSGMVLCGVVDTLPKALLKTPPRIRAPSHPLSA